MLCNECKRRNKCTKLCNEAKEYADQDKPNYHKPGEGIHFTPVERKIVTLVMSGKNRRQIRNLLKLSAIALRAHIKRLRKKRDMIVL
jgi:DNA-binding CsgD family transcriptional regulator